MATPYQDLHTMLSHPTAERSRSSVDHWRTRLSRRAAARGVALLAALVLLVAASAGPTTANDSVKTDTDGDGFSDGAERFLGSDPESSASTPELRFIGGTCDDGIDNDADGVVDADDLACAKFGSYFFPYFFPYWAAVKTDTDGDGFSDGAERFLGSDPESSASTPERRFIGTCDDGLDNDGDGAVDGDDPACVKFSFGAHSSGSKTDTADASDPATTSDATSGDADGTWGDGGSKATWGDGTWGDRSWGDRSWGDGSWGDGTWGDGDSKASWGDGTWGDGDSKGSWGSWDR